MQTGVCLPPRSPRPGRRRDPAVSGCSKCSRRDAGSHPPALPCPPSLRVPPAPPGSPPPPRRPSSPGHSRGSEGCNFHWPSSPLPPGERRPTGRKTGPASPETPPRFCTPPASHCTTEVVPHALPQGPAPAPALSRRFLSPRPRCLRLAGCRRLPPSRRQPRKPPPRRSSTFCSSSASPPLSSPSIISASKPPVQAPRGNFQNRKPFSPFS